jgi:hypothetical protein
MVDPQNGSLWGVQMKAAFMKKIIAISVLSVFANLAGIARAQAETVLAEVRAVSATIQTVQLTDSGTLNVIGMNNAQAVIPLSAANSAKLVNAAQTLNNTPVATVYHAMVCMMMLNADTAQNLYVGTGSETDLKMVLSDESCAIHNHTGPTDSAMATMAEQLKTQMVVLSEQLSQ